MPLRATAGARRLLAWLAVAVVASAVTYGVAARPPAPVATAALIPPVAPGPQPAQLPLAEPAHALDAADLASWLDGMLPAALKQAKGAGAVVSVVKDGKLLLARGYGYADMARKTPMDPDRTLVRPGSTSKLFTWTAVMQLVEQGKLDLDTDVNRYLDFRLPEPFGRPITLNDLMTHRGGFQEGLKDVLVTDPARKQPLGELLKRHLPPVLFAPGSVPAYSNYGTAIAGYIVQRISGEPFEAYVARHIFAPLRMNRSTFDQPLPAGWAADMSRGYRSTDAAPQPFEIVTVTPAGGLSTTAADMANFMLAHLGDGRLGDGIILRPETARLMHTPSIAAPAGFDVMAHGFFAARRNGRLLLEHGGDTILFHSDLALLPHEHVGIFMSFNSRGEGDAIYGVRERLFEGFLDRYFPAPAEPAQPALASAKADAARIAGRYETSRRVQSGFMSLFYVLQGQEVVAPRPDGTIALSSAPGKAFREIAPQLWREVGGARMLRLTTIGGVRSIADSQNPAGVVQEAPLRHNAALNGAIFAGSLLVLIGGAVAWAIAEGARRFYRQPPALAGRALLARRLARIAILADLIYLFAWFLVLKPILSSDVAFYTTARDPLIHTLQIAGLVPLAGAVVGLWHAWNGLQVRRHWLLAAGGAAISAALVGVAWIAYVGGLLSLTLNY